MVLDCLVARRSARRGFGAKDQVNAWELATAGLAR